MSCNNTETAIDRARHLLRGKAQWGREREGAYVRRRRQLAFVAMTTVLAGAVTAVVLATPGSGIVSANVVARANFQNKVDIRFKVKDGRQHVLNVANAAETVMQQVVIAPGGHTGWHSHPGPVFVMVTAGTLAFYQADDPDNPTYYDAGEGFVEDAGRVHLAANEGDVDLELDAFLLIPQGEPARIDEPAP